jgi:hypothetical protein
MDRAEQIEIDVEGRLTSQINVTAACKSGESTRLHGGPIDCQLGECSVV